MSGHPQKRDIWQNLVYGENNRKILQTLKEGPRNVTKLAQTVKASRQTVSRHLQRLKEDNLVYQKGRNYFLADKGTAMLEKIKILELTSQLEATQELSLPLSYAKNLEKMLKNHSIGDFSPSSYDKMFDSRFFGKWFPEEIYREYGVKKVNKIRAQMAALVLCKAFRISVFQDAGDRKIDLNREETSEFLTYIWNAASPIFQKGLTKFAFLVTFDFDTAKSYFPEVTKEFFGKKNR